MKKMQSLVLGLICALVASQPVKVRSQAVEVLTFNTVAEPMVLGLSASAFSTALIGYGAIRVAQAVSEPLGNYEVGLRQWRGTESEDLQGVQGWSFIRRYRFDPDSRAQYYQEVRRLWVVDEDGYWSDQTVNYDMFLFNSDNMDVHHTYYEGTGNDVFQSYSGNVDEYYVKRNGAAWFGRPVRVHVTGFQWTPNWISPDTSPHKTIVGDWSHNQWCFVPRNSFATFMPNYVNASYVGAGYTTTFYEGL